MGELDTLLIQATDLSIEQIEALCTQAGGLCVAAHINRSSNSLLGNLGFLPPRPRFAALEVYRGAPAPRSTPAPTRSSTPPTRTAWGTSPSASSSSTFPSAAARVSFPTCARVKTV